MKDDNDATLNIGALSMATGVPVETIRTWERRYGFPKSQRNEAGHRIYEVEMIEYLRLITTILSKGYRPSQLEGHSQEELKKLLARSITEAEEPEEFRYAESSGDTSMQWLGSWIDATAHLDREQLWCSLRSDFSRLNTFDFFDHRLKPYLVELGERWSAGDLDVYQEHFASECVRDYLTTIWRPLSQLGSGNPVILATPAGEEHSLGLQMAAVAVALAQREVVYLGGNTPAKEAARAARQSGADSVVVSVSAFFSAAAATEFLDELSTHLDDRLEIFVGGTGAPEESGRWRVPDTLRELHDLVQNGSKSRSD